MPLLRRSVRPALVAAAFASMTLAGCNNAPPGNTGGTFDPNQRTKIDARDPAADSVTLLEFARSSGQELALEFLSIPAIQNSQFQVVIELGSIQNNTRTPSSDFAQVQRRVFLTLAQSDLVRKGARVVERRARVAADAAGVSVPPQVDPLGREVATQPSGGMADYPLEATYFLQGTFSELSRGGGRQSTYQFDVTLTNARSREIVFAKIMDSKQDR